MRVHVLAAVVFIFLCGISPVALSFRLSTEGTALEQSVAKKYSNWWRRIAVGLSPKGLDHFTEPVHEEITNRIYDCQGDVDVCGNPNVGFASNYVLAGVRWNDDPPFRLDEGEGRGTTCKVNETIRFTTQPGCWYELFRDAKKKAESGKVLNAASRTSLLGRSHFGDLQFIHSMATRDGEPAAETRKRIIMWAQFTWGISVGQHGIGAKLREIPVEGMQDHFGRADWTVQDLFTLGNPSLRREIKAVAFGSFLHMVQDSFAKGHTDRAEAIQGRKCDAISQYAAPGVIRSFRAYNNQDSGKHGESDSRNAFSAHWSVERPSIVEVGQVFLAFYERLVSWAEVRPYVECVFAIENADTPASAGAAFLKSR
jgi:hypothetical protein